jgi:Fe(II)/alpha-ketoglutarate-dependent arginine beta-hydroxylase
VTRLLLDPAERASITALVDSAAARYDRIDDPELLEEVSVLAHELPRRLRRFLCEYRNKELGLCIIAGHDIDQVEIGATPAHWNLLPPRSSTFRFEAILLLYGSLLGDVFGWTTQQDGRLVHDVLPIKGHEQEQLGSGSQTLLTWHTEDAFHPYRSDYIVLACLRNPYGAVTTVGNIDDLELSEDDVDVLFQERFIIRPDQSHLPTNNSADGAASFAFIEQLNTAPPPVAVLFGSRNRPYMRADPYFMTVPDGDAPAARALDHFIAAMDAAMRDVVLAPGEICFLDNFKVVHGRKPFTARLDGTDRWLKRICITRDLRKSRDARASLASRLIG